MKQIPNLLLIFILISYIPCFAQNNNNTDVFQKADNAVNKVNTIIAVFQPYLLKARQLYYEGKQLAGDVKNSANSTFGKNGTMNNNGSNGAYSSGNNNNQSGFADPAYNNNQSGYNNTNNSNGYNTSGNSSFPAASNSGNTGAYNGNNNSQNQGGFNNSGNGYSNGQVSNSGSGMSTTIQDYLPNQSLPVNNPASINNDGTGNWGNQNNGLYGNCLDALTGTVLGMGEAQERPGAVDLMFFAPSDGQGTYTLMTPGFARNNSTATYMTEHASDPVMQWSDVNETEVALTRMTLGQFDQIQNNNQILNAVRMAPNYAGYYSAVGQKLDGMVFAVKAELESRQVYALVAIYRQIGTSGNNGYLKIKIKAQGLDANANGAPTANYYQR
jgi:hypothetical protein